MKKANLEFWEQVAVDIIGAIGPQQGWELSPTEIIPAHIYSRLANVAAYTEAVGGKLKSRQVIAAIIASMGDE